jgi:predicted signal transduction protein with EAL and GGDEF domain
VDEKIAEYESLRNEISQRLGFQQQIINFTIVVAGFLVPLLVKYKNLGDTIILSLFILNTDKIGGK